MPFYTLSSLNIQPQYSHLNTELIYRAAELVYISKQVNSETVGVKSPQLVYTVFIVSTSLEHI